VTQDQSVAASGDVIVPGSGGTASAASHAAKRWPMDGSLECHSCAADSVCKAWTGCGVHCTRPDSDTINFREPGRQTGALGPSVVQLIAGSADPVLIRVHGAALLVVPPYRKHSVDAIAKGKETASESTFCSLHSASA
jgi:hypothetical protein